MVGQGAILPVELVRERIGGVLSGILRSAASPHEDPLTVLAHAAEELNPRVSLALRPPGPRRASPRPAACCFWCAAFAARHCSRHYGRRAVLHEGGVRSVRRAVKRGQDCALRPRSPKAAPEDRPNSVSAAAR
eukprot:161461-Chlamydomonas_euryale.AAC.1